MHPNEDTLHEFVENALDASARSEVERHLESCATCRQFVDDLREIRSVAASLEPRNPPVRAWTRLERAIKLEQTPHAAAARKRGTATYLWLGVAAALVLAVWAGMRFRPAQPGPAAPATTAADAPADQPAVSTSDAAQSVEAELRQAEDHYEKAIKGLEQIASAEQGVFDPRTAATLQKNLAVIDQAIGESRAALRQQPTSEPAQQSLMESFKAKIALLQDTVALINEMRKGNDAGAARAVSGLKQRGA
jgi:hypothetical protein